MSIAFPLHIYGAWCVLPAGGPASVGCELFLAALNDLGHLWSVTRVHPGVFFLTECLLRSVVYCFNLVT